MKRGEQGRDEMVKDVNGQILHDGVEVRRRWTNLLSWEIFSHDREKVMVYYTIIM